MKAKRTTYEKSISYVEHKKNFQRTLNTFSKYNRDISIKYNKSLKRWEFECLYRFEHLSENKEIVYNPVYAKEMLQNTSAILNAIDGMFEYKKYANTIKDFVSSMEESETIDGKEISINMFFQKEISSIKNLLKYKLETIFLISLTDKTLSKIYNSIKNRVCFKPIYCDEDEKYYTYKNSQLDRFVLCTPIYRPADYAIRQLVKQHYEIYNKYYYLIPLAENAFEYYLNQNDSFAQNDSITLEWKKEYSFLERNGIFQSLYQSMDFLNNYMCLFHNEVAYPVKLFSLNKKVYTKSIEKHLRHVLTEKSIKLIDIEHWRMMYKVLIEEIPDYNWQTIFLTLMKWPKIYGEYPSTLDKNIQFKKYLDISFETKNNKKSKQKIATNQHPPIPF